MHKAEENKIKVELERGSFSYFKYIKEQLR